MNNNCKHDRKHYDCPYCVIDELKAKAEAMQKALENIVAHRGNIISKTYFECINIAELALKEDTPCEHDYKMELGRPICTKCGLQPEHPYF